VDRRVVNRLRLAHVIIFALTLIMRRRGLGRLG